MPRRGWLLLPQLSSQREAAGGLKEEGGEGGWERAASPLNEWNTLLV